MISQLEKFSNFLKDAPNIIVCGHENPDPDSIGSCIALEYLLTTLGHNVLCINSDKTPSNLVKLDYRNILMSLEDGDILPDSLKNYSLIVVDTNDLPDTGQLKDKIIKKIKNIFFIDHHSIQKKRKVNNIFHMDSASSTCEIIYHIYIRLRIPVPKEIGDAIYSGILYDTGSFHYPKTSYYTFKIAARIIKKGTNPNEIYMLVYEKESVQYVKALSKVMSGLKLYLNDQLAVICLTKEILDSSGVHPKECSGFINIPLKSDNIKVVVYYKENLDGKKRISLRSKNEIDVAKLAFSFKGGGHRNAAGFKIVKKNDNPDIIIEKIIDYFRNILST